MLTLEYIFESTFRTLALGCESRKGLDRLAGNWMLVTGSLLKDWGWRPEGKLKPGTEAGMIDAVPEFCAFVALLRSTKISGGKFFKMQACV